MPIHHPPVQGSRPIARRLIANFGNPGDAAQAAADMSGRGFNAQAIGQDPDWNQFIDGHSALRHFVAVESVSESVLERAFKELSTLAAGYVYLEALPAAPPGAPTIFDQRTLFGAERGGVGVFVDPSVWRKAGGKGRNITIIDLEQGWNLHHRELRRPSGIQLLAGVNHAYRDHGTRTLGVLTGDHGPARAVGVRGLVPEARVGVVSLWHYGQPQKGGWEVPLVADLPLGILKAAQHLSPGDILLLEAQTTLVTPGKSVLKHVPVDVEPLVHAAIRELVDHHQIVVVQAAGNGGHDLDKSCVQLGDERWMPFRGQQDDTGAIMVGGSVWQHGAHHRRHPKSNYGRRVSCFSHATSVPSSSSDPLAKEHDGYTMRFSGTSAAAAVIAGVAGIVQSLVHEQTGGRRLTPRALRALLRDPAFSTGSVHPTVDRIGRQPDLERILGGLGQMLDGLESDALTGVVSVPGRE